MLLTNRLRDILIWGLLLILGAIALVELPSLGAFSISPLLFLLGVVAFAAFQGGLYAGIVSALLASSYAAYFLSIPDQPFQYAGTEGVRLVFFVVAALATALMTGGLRRELRASQAKLREQLEFRKAIDQSLDEGVYALDDNGRLTYMNPAAERIFGWTAAELRGKAMHDVTHYLHPDGRPYPREECAGLQVLREGVVYRSEEDTFIRKDGNMFPVAYSSAPIKMNGQIAGVVVALRDITERKRIEASLKTSEERLRLIIDQLPAVVWTTDRDLNFTSATGSGLPHLGLSANNLLGISLYDYGQGKDGSFPPIAAHKQALDGEHLAFEAAWASRTWQVHVEPFYDSQGEVIGCLGIAIDVTERKRAEDALRASEAKLRLITAQLPAHIWTTDSELRVTSVSGAAVTQLGISPSNFIGKYLPELVDMTAAHVSPTLSVHRRALAGEPAGYELDTRGRQFDARVEPLRDSTGRIVGVLGIALDITERKRAEEALRVHAAQQAAIAALGARAVATPDLTALLQDAIQVIVQTLRIELCKVLELLPEQDQLVLRAGVGWKEGTIGRAMVAATPDTHAGFTLRSHAPVVVEDLATETRFRPPELLTEHGVVSTMSVVIYHRNGPFGVLEADTTQRRLFSNDDIHFLQAIANILTAAIQRKEFEDELAAERTEAARREELDRLRRQFVLSVSHELRTPLTVAQGGLGMLDTSVQERLGSDERKLLSTCRRSIDRLRMLIDDLLVYNQFEAGTLNLKLGRADLREIVASVLPIIYPPLNEKVQRLELDLPEPLLAEIDRSRLAHALTNLVTYIHERVPARTAIGVSGQRVERGVQLIISDQGSGLPIEDAEMIFQHFHRLGLAEDGSGVGIGVASTLIQLQGGEISVEQLDGKGVFFRITLPAATDG